MKCQISSAVGKVTLFVCCSSVLWRGTLKWTAEDNTVSRPIKVFFFLSYFKTKSSGHFDMNRFVASCKQTYTWLVGMNQKFIVNEQRLIFLVICHYISFLNNKKHAKTFNPGCYVICWKLHVVTFSRFARPVELK